MTDKTKGIICIIGFLGTCAICVYLLATYVDAEVRGMCAIVLGMIAGWLWRDAFKKWME